MAGRWKEAIALLRVGDRVEVVFHLRGEVSRGTVTQLLNFDRESCYIRFDDRPEPSYTSFTTASSIRKLNLLELLAEAAMG